jgi:hypothetical protein
MRYLSVLLFIGVMACSSDERTQYHKYDKDKGGYKDMELGEELRMTSFQGNSRTKNSYAELFARYHSLEECRSQGKSFSHILAVIDKTNTKKVMRSYSDYWGPSYYYSPYYSRYGGMGWSTGVNFANTRTWEETLTFPEFEVIYHCADKMYEPALAMRDVPPDEMKHLVKDLKGGVQVEKVLPGSPNKDIKVNDIILSSNGRRIMKGHELLADFIAHPNGVKVELLREGVRKSVTLKGKEVTEPVKENLTALKKEACDFEDVKEKSKVCGEKW